MNEELPEGWATVSVERSVEIIDYRGRTPPYSPNGIPHLRSSNLKGGKVVWENLRYVSEDVYRRYMTRGIPHVGDLLFSTEAPLGEVAEVPTSRFSVAQRLMILRTDSRVLDPQFLKLQIMSPEFQDRISGRSTGTMVIGISAKNFRPVKMKIAPVDEQRRIVLQVEALLAKVRSSQERLDKIPTILKRFRQAVLAAACTGRLTEDWRERHPDLAQIEATVMRIRQRRERAASTPAQRERVKEIYEEAEEHDSDELPEAWRYVKLNKLCQSFDYGTSAKSQASGKVPVLRMGNIQDGKIDWTDLVYTSDADEIASYSLRPRTVLFNRTNSPELVGKTAIYRGERPAIFAGYLIRANHEPDLDPEYLNLCLNTTYAKEFCRNVKTDGVSQSNINAQKLGAFELPFCAIEEQREITRRVKELFALADRLQARYEKAKAQVDRLTRSVLAKAFRGELVPTEADLAKAEGRSYETAEQLLARIKNEQATASENGGKRKNGAKRHARR